MRAMILITLMVIVQVARCQEIDNKINIYLGYGIGGFGGQEIIKEGNFILPSLYANYNYLNGMSFKGLVKGNQFCSLGLAFDYLSTSNWKNLNYSDYVNSGVKQYSVSPIVQFHNKFKETGIFNRIRIICEIAPTIGLSDLTLAFPLFDIKSENSTVSPPMQSRDPYFGVKANAGLELVLSRALGLFFTYSVQHYWISSDLYPDKNFSGSQLELGVFLRFKRDKRNLYR